MCACSCLSSFHGVFPAGAENPHHITAIIARLANTTATASSHASRVYLMASLQCLLAGAPRSRQHLVSAGVVPTLLSAAALGQLLPTQNRPPVALYSSSTELATDVGIHLQASTMLSEVALSLLSQLVMTNGAADPKVVQQASCCLLLPWASLLPCICACARRQLHLSTWMKSETCLHP